MNFFLDSALLAFLKATDTRQNASFAVRLPSRRELRGED